MTSAAAAAAAAVVVVAAAAAAAGGVACAGWCWGRGEGRRRRRRKRRRRKRRWKGGSESEGPSRRVGDACGTPSRSESFPTDAYPSTQNLDKTKKDASYCLLFVVVVIVVYTVLPCFVTHCKMFFMTPISLILL